ncbi:hypothetical protein C0Q70_05276 [Pomacea canaliculata]|uniref:Uncharacterized protein n=1 Tax=Pomacea canaliculata TaxID=400727 RepID=A0A2T7PKT6_POMCA|nr:hypothetical protein C0Q70_05276 [Pomacea canaliculata]
MTRLHHYGQGQHGSHHAVLHAGRQSGAGNAGEHRSVRRAVAMRPSASSPTLGLKERHKQALRGLSTVLWSCLAARRGSGASLQALTCSLVSSGRLIVTAENRLLPASDVIDSGVCRAGAGGDDDPGDSGRERLITRRIFINDDLTAVCDAGPDGDSGISGRVRRAYWLYVIKDDLHDVRATCVVGFRERKVRRLFDDVWPSKTNQPSSTSGEEEACACVTTCFR